MLSSCSSAAAGAHPWGLVPNLCSASFALERVFLVYVSEKKLLLFFFFFLSPNQFTNINVLGAEFLTSTVLYIFTSPGYCFLLCNKIGLLRWENSLP